MSNEPTPPIPPIWLLTGDLPTGPYDPAQVHAKLAAGEVTWQTPACPVGGSTWLPLVRLPGYGPPAAVPRRAAVPPPAPSAPLPSSKERVQIRTQTRISAAAPSRPLLPWNPAAIGWLGVLFMPPWAGVMAALNGRRLRSPTPIWLPLAIGFGYLAVDQVIGALIDSYLVCLMLYLGASWLLWWLVLRPQFASFSARLVAQPGATARWTWPAVAGAPLALVAFLGLVVAPLMPLEPRQVCERFNAAPSAHEAARYTTLNLVPALEALYAENDLGEPSDFELTDEAEAAPEFGGYLVGFRVAFVEAGQPVQMEGVYHLVNFTGEWKIEDLYFTTIDHQPLEAGIRLSTDYVALLRQPRPAPVDPGDPPQEDPAWSWQGPASAGGTQPVGPRWSSPSPGNEPRPETRGWSASESFLRGLVYSLVSRSQASGGKTLKQLVTGVVLAIGAGIASLWWKPKGGESSPGGDARA